MITTINTLAFVYQGVEKIGIVLYTFLVALLICSMVAQFVVFKKYDYISLVQLLLLIAVFVYDSVLAIAIMYFIGQTLSVFIYGRYSEKYIGYKIKDQIIDIIKPASYSFVMCAAIYPLSIIIHNSLFCVVLQIITSIVIYFGLSSLLKDKIFYYIIKSIKKILK